MVIGIVVGVVVLLFIFWFIGAQNKLVKQKNQFKNSFAQIDVQLKRRYDLTPNLVETAKGYMKHEKETLDAVMKARSGAAALEKAVAQDPANAQAMKQFMAAEGALTGALGKMMVTVEAYPDLKANSTMQSLMEELTSTENRVAFARQAYNDAVMQYNTTRESIPTSIVANFLNFSEAFLFEIEVPEEREAVKVSF